MKNKKLNSLITKAHKIDSENKAKEFYKAPIPKNKKIQFREFKLYYALLDNRNDGWGIIDILGVALFSLLAFFAIIAHNESNAFLYFKIFAFIGAVFFITKVFLIKPTIHSVKYLVFNDWIKNTHINIIGWDKVYNNDEILSENNWYQQCNVIIKLDSSCPLITKTLVEAAVVVFIDNTKWVQFNFSSGANAWEINEYNLTGSANSWVLGYLQRFISDDLSVINKTYGGIVSIEIKTNEKMTQISRAETYTSGM